VRARSTTSAARATIRASAAQSALSAKLDFTRRFRLDSSRRELDWLAVVPPGLGRLRSGLCSASLLA